MLSVYRAKVTSFKKLLLIIHTDSQTGIHTSQVDSAFYPPWDGKISTSQRSVMFCCSGVKAGMV